MKQWACGGWLGLSALVSAEALGYWGFAKDGVTAGQALARALNSRGDGVLNAKRAAGDPTYPDEVPVAEIFDPVSRMGSQNQWSFDAGQSAWVERSLDLLAWGELGTRTADGAPAPFQEVTVPAGRSVVFDRVTRQSRHS